MRNKVEKLLLKWGNNPKEVNEMLNLHFDRYEQRTDLTAKEIATTIRTIY